MFRQDLFQVSLAQQTAQNPNNSLKNDEPWETGAFELGMLYPCRKSKTISKG